jgi:DNA-binding MarR family transcriptional regulator
MRLCHTEECLTQAKVSRLAELDENMTSQVIRVLERRGWVIRVKHPTDRRAHRIELTDSGIKLAMAARTLVKEAAERFFEPLGDRREEFVDALRTLNAHAAG